MRVREYMYKMKKALRIESNWLLWIYMALLIFVSAGSVSAILEGSRAAPGTLIIGNRSAETGIEALIFGLSMVLGMIGGFLLYKGTGVSSRRVANIYIIGGLSLMAIGMAIMGWLAYLKT